MIDGDACLPQFSSRTQSLEIPVSLYRVALCLLVALLLIAREPVADAEEQTRAGVGGPKTSLDAETESRVESHLNLTYAERESGPLRLDLYRPKKIDETLPAVVCIHGGGWWRGDRRSQTDLAKALAARGYVTATITYRLSGVEPFPTQIHDCKAAVRFLRAHAEQYGIDADHIGATGLSAGGHLATLLATSNDVEPLEGTGPYAEFSSTIQAAVPMGAQSNFRRHHANVEKSNPKPDGPKPNIWVQFLDGKPSEAPENWRLASPMTHLDAVDGPMLFVSGEKDNVTTRAAEFRDQMRSLGIPEGAAVIANAPHAFLGRQVFFDEAVDQAAGWFDQHLKKSPAP